MSSKPGTLRVIVVGCGNIGSHLVGHLARLPAVARLVLVDPDRYSATNIASQDVLARDLGKPKVAVQAERARRIRRDLRVDAHALRVEQVPLGRLRGDVVFSCVDSRAARRAINQIAGWLGMFLIDAGVSGDAHLVRAATFDCGAHDAPCLQCPWDDEAYAQMEELYPCAGGDFVDSIGARAPAPATNAPSGLGAIAAGLQAVELGKWLDRGVAGAAPAQAGVQVLMDLAHHRHHVMRFARNRECRAEHAVWAIEPRADLSIAMRVGELFARLDDGTAAVEIGLAGQRFARRLACPRCGHHRTDVLRVAGRLGDDTRMCDACHGAMVPPGFYLDDWLTDAACTAFDRKRTLEEIGLERGDVLSVRHADAATTKHYEIGGGP